MIGYARLVVFKIYACEGKGLSAVAREQDSERVNRPFVVISITAAQRVDVGRHQQYGLTTTSGDFQLRDNATCRLTKENNGTGGEVQFGLTKCYANLGGAVDSGDGDAAESKLLVGLLLNIAGKNERP